MRKYRCISEVDSETKLILDGSKTRAESQRLILREKKIQRFYKTQCRKFDNCTLESNNLLYSPHSQKVRLNPRDQHVDLISFSQKVVEIIFIV